VLRQGDLAGTLELIADSGAAAFYQGRIANLIVEEMRQSGGLISRADLAGYRARWRMPITTSYRGWRVISMPPSSSGGVTLTQILNVMEGFRPLPPFGSPELLHLEVEAMRRAFEDRNRHLGDPDFVAMPLRRLLSKRYAAGLRRAIDRGRATPTEPAAAGTVVPWEGTHTTHYSVVDAEGNAAAVTTTLNDSYGSAVTVRGAGFLLNDEMDDFTTKPGTPNLYGLVQGAANAIRPGKRMLSAMTPTIVLNPRGRLALVLGSPGGPTIITTVYHVLSNVIDHGMSLSRAVAAPRIHHQGRPDRIAWEPDGLSPWVVETLERMGHSLAPRARWIGDVQAIRVSADGLEGVADPRRGGGAAGY
jgi:gamma-glutamyltranspeptidase/glutathione hydrolase